MPAYPLRTLVLRKTKLGETDLILTMLAADGRQVRAVAKGARKPKSRLGARTEPFTVLDVLLHTGRNLEILTEAETVATHDALRADYDRTMAASVVVDVLDKVSVEGQGEPLLFDMALVLKALAMHGYRPSLDACASCGGHVSSLPRFSVEAGGVVCDGCGGPGSVYISEDALALLRALLRARMSEVPEMEADPSVRREVLSIVRAHTGFHVPSRLRALDYFMERQ
jgi:DNA repair protein RecO (recombination protein O)